MRIREIWMDVIFDIYNEYIHPIYIMTDENDYDISLCYIWIETKPEEKMNIESDELIEIYKDLFRNISLELFIPELIHIDKI
jgi:hypothetical protein